MFFGGGDHTASFHTTESSRILSVMELRNFLLSLVAYILVSIASASCNLPVIFFHGATLTYESGQNFVANLTAEGRTVVSLSFCDGVCSVKSLLLQLPEALKAVHDVVTNDSMFDNGYIFIGHSLGAMLARAVIEEMDNHKVKRLVSVAGLQNGQFIGPASDVVESVTNGALLNAYLPETVFNYSLYGPEDYHGKLQRDIALYTIENPDTQYEHSLFNTYRWPQFGSFSTTNFFLPVYNNVNHCVRGDNQCLDDQERRKTNFLKLEQAHFFASPNDEILRPWQTSIFGRYSEVDSIEEIVTAFNNLTVVDVKDTDEYTADTYGLQSLDKRGGLFLYAVANVSHMCWVEDAGDCSWATVYDQYIYSTLI